MPQNRFADVRRFESIDSTNRYLLDEARAGAAGGVVAVADHQTAGRGRLGRSWEAPPGANLLLSVLLRPDLEPSDRHLATTAVALAAVDAIGVLGLEVRGGPAATGPTGTNGPAAAEPTGTNGPAATGPTGTNGPAATGPTGTNGPASTSTAAGAVGIKWPNDLVDGSGRKLAGVLAETDLSPSSGPVGLPAPIVVGIGINVNWPGADSDLPHELRGLAVSLRMLTGGPVDREALLAGVLDALDQRTADLGTVDGRRRLSNGLLAGCTTIGTRVRVDLADGSFQGTARGVTPEGHLLVESDGRTRTVVAGDVVHLRPGT
jgi:BirA family transcriptional regulator, biotin operon repressor / biotin---[acetyl-CoA-carboxylase] ligase